MPAYYAKGFGSLAGMVGVGAAVCVAVLFLFSDIHKNRKILCGVFVVAVGLVALFCGKIRHSFALS